MKKTLLPGILALCLGGLHANAQTILLNDNFDTYTSQSEFLAAWPVVGTQPSAALSTVQSVSGPNSIQVVSSTTTAEAPRNQRTFTESGDAGVNPIVFSFDFYDGNAAAAPYRQYASLQDGTAPSGSGQLIAMGLNNNLTATAEGGNFYMARILGFNTGAFFKLNDNPSLLRSTGWHNLGVEITSSEFRFFVDGVLAETVANTFTARSYDVVRLGAGVSSPVGVFFDNVSVTVVPVPEPTGFALAGLGAAALLIFRRRS